MRSLVPRKQRGGLRISEMACQARVLFQRRGEADLVRNKRKRHAAWGAPMPLAPGGWPHTAVSSAYCGRGLPGRASERGLALGRPSPRSGGRLFAFWVRVSACVRASADQEDGQTAPFFLRRLLSISVALQK